MVWSVLGLPVLAVVQDVLCYGGDVVGKCCEGVGAGSCAGCVGGCYVVQLWILCDVVVECPGDFCVWKIFSSGDFFW